MLIIFMLYKEIKYYYYIKRASRMDKPKKERDEVAAVKYYLKAWNTIFKWS